MHTSLLTIYTSNRLEVLRDRLADTLREAPVGALEREVIVVQSRGMYRWLTLELARVLGIAAGLATPFPGTFCRALVERFRAGAKPDPFERYEPSKRSAYDSDMLTWRLFGLLAARAGHTTAGAAAYLADDPDQQKRYQLAVRLAERFDDYQLYRPDILEAWEKDRQPILAPEYREHAEWQADLWRTVRQTARAAGEVSPLEGLRSLVERLSTSESAPLELPRRVHLFALSTLAPLQLRLFAALAQHVPVAFYVLEPTEKEWSDIVPEQTADRLRERVRERGLAPGYAHADIGNTLLSALSRQGREFHELLLDVDELGSAWTALRFEVPERDSLLHTLQADVAELVDRRPEPDPRLTKPTLLDATPAAGAAPFRIAPDDRSLEIHVCHSPMREMEVLRDVLLDAFANDPTLRPHDVFVLAPDIAGYAPYVEAVFGSESGRPAIPFTIADRSPRYEEPTVEAAMRLLALIGSRITASSVMELLDYTPIRSAAGITAEEAGTLRSWVREANIRWAADAEHRRQLLPTVCDDVDTWRSGLDRLLMGYAADADDGLVNGILPLGSGAAEPDLLGRGLEYFDRLLARLRALDTPRPLDRWAADLHTMLDDLLDPETEPQQVALRSMLDHVEELALARTHAGLAEPVHIEAVRAHLGQRMERAAGGAGFITGGVTFCGLKPLRAIPAKIICLAGMNEGAVPSLDRRLSFDVMAAERRRGDRLPRDEDRHVFLQTLLGAGERFVLSYVGRSQKDNSELAPSVLVSELLDYVDRAFATHGGDPVRESVVVEHPLQPFSRRYFTSADGGEHRLFSYSEADRRAAEAAAGAKTRPEPFCTTPLRPSEARTEVSLKELADFLVNPSKHFCREVLGLRLAEDTDDFEDAEPFGLDALARYKHVSRLVSCYFAGASDCEKEFALIRAAGDVPHAAFAHAHLLALDANARELVRAASRFTGPPPCERLPLVADLEHADWRLTGLVESITRNCLVRFRPAKIKPKDKLHIWVEHLVVCALRERGDPTATPLPVDAFLIGTDTCIRLRPVEDAYAELDRLIRIYREGMCRPLPLFEAASHAFAEQNWALATNSRATRDPWQNARERFLGESKLGAGFAPLGDILDPYVALCVRDRNPLEDEREEFGSLASTVWTRWFQSAQKEER